MTTANHKSLPPQARKRIEKLEHTVAELTGALSHVVAEMRRQGLTVSVKKSSSPVLKSIVRSGAPAASSPKGNRRDVADATQPAAQSTPVAKSEGRQNLSLARGEAAKVAWVQADDIVPAKVLAEKWGLTPQALGPAAERDEVFAVVVKRQRYYRKEFLELHREEVATVVQALAGLAPEERLVFWKRPHGALGGKTVSALLRTREKSHQLRVLQLAQASATQAQGHAAMTA